jgi:23S rRNA (pseudouridine1915-N3)-methyltransferase
MRILLVAVGEKPPAWVKEGFAEYAKRLPKPFAPELVELPLGHRGKGADPARAIAAEGERVLAALPKNAYLIALDERGRTWTSVELAREFAQWQLEGRDIVFVIGGPDGHAPAVVARANQKWSFGPLTLPHMLVRLVWVEQIYRAWTIQQGHPYHRE